MCHSFVKVNHSAVPYGRLFVPSRQTAQKEPRPRPQSQSQIEIELGELRLHTTAAAMGDGVR